MDKITLKTNWKQTELKTTIKKQSKDQNKWKIQNYNTQRDHPSMLHWLGTAHEKLLSHCC